MYNLAILFPVVRRYRIPISRDQTMLLLAAINEFLLGLETYIAHLTSGTIVPYEWIPIFFGPIAGFLLMLAGLLATRQRVVATVIATFVFAASILVGVLGAFLHLMRASLPSAPIGEVLSIPLLVWAPPLLGPFTFALVGVLGISAAWIEDPPDSGTLILLRGNRLSLPYSKTRAFLYLTSLGALATVTSSVLDHARTDFSNPWLWLPTGIGIFATVVALVLALVKIPSQVDIGAYFTAMVLMLIIGVLGTILHISQNLTTQGVIVADRFLRGAPFLAPMLFADIGVIGLAAILDPVEKRYGG